jgi:anti-sigma regulatory factor (Ser/Thr protein kinase)
VETLLIEEWTGDAEAIFVLDEASLSLVRERIRDVASSSGVAAEIVDRAVVVASELGRNQLRHALAGRIIVRAITRRQGAEGEHRGLEITAIDRGSGLADAAAALDQWRKAREEGSLGVGVGSIRRLSSEVDFDVRLGEGMRINARLFADAVPRRREIGIYGRPHSEEKVSGDHGAFCRMDGSSDLVIVVTDGLGHGPLAREASYVAMQAVYAHASETPARILEASEQALTETRGVVMAVCRIDEAAATMEAASIGNVELQVCSPRAARRFGGSSAVVGGKGNRPTKPRTESAPLAANDVVVLSTDGISSKLSIEEDLALLRDHPIVIAQRIVERFGRTNDDALVLVAR